MDYKLSKYNVEFEDNDVVYCWNTYSGACIRLDNDGIEYVKQFNGKSDKSDYFEILKKNGFIVPQVIDETGRVLSEEKSTLQNMSPNRLCFTIAPGLNCNCNCSYCFESENMNGLIMTEEVKRKVIEYIAYRIDKDKSIKILNISWFGGEPLLYIDIIKSMSEEIMRICENHGISYSAGIVTNGLLLDSDMVDVLALHKIKQAQVSIDDSEESFCRVRNKTSQDFKTVLVNIRDASNKIKISVRINADAYSNADRIKRIVDLLYGDYGLYGKVSVNLGFIRNQSISDEEEMENHGKHAELQRYLNEYIFSNYGNACNVVKSPKRRISGCLQSCRANVCIGPEGEFYRCEHYFGDKLARIGDVDNGYYCNGFDNRYYVDTHMEKCLGCAFFPLCMGGCIDDRVNDRRIINCDKMRRGLIGMQLSAIKNQEV